MNVNIKNNSNTIPSLVEPGVKYFFTQTLKQCHKFREDHYDLLINIGLFLTFLTIFGLWLLYKYKGKLTPEEMKEKSLEKKKYILSKIQNYQDSKKREEQELITGLPHWEREF